MSRGFSCHAAALSVQEVLLAVEKGYCLPRATSDNRKARVTLQLLLRQGVQYFCVGIWSMRKNPRPVSREEGSEGGPKA